MKIKERIFSIKMERLYLTNRWNYQWLLSSSRTKKLKAKWTSITCDAREKVVTADERWQTILNPVFSGKRASLDIVASGPFNLSQLHNAEEERKTESNSSSLSDDHSEQEKDERERQTKRNGKLGNPSNSTIQILKPIYWRIKESNKYQIKCQ